MDETKKEDFLEPPPLDAAAAAPGFALPTPPSEVRIKVKTDIPITGFPQWYLCPSGTTCREVLERYGVPDGQVFYEGAFLPGDAELLKFVREQDEIIIGFLPQVVDSVNSSRRDQNLEAMPLTSSSSSFQYVTPQGENAARRKPLAIVHLILGISVVSLAGISILGSRIYSWTNFGGQAGSIVGSAGQMFTNIASLIYFLLLTLRLPETVTKMTKVDNILVKKSLLKTFFYDT
jgi:hypothetical protein